MRLASLLSGRLELLLLVAVVHRKLQLRSGRPLCHLLDSLYPCCRRLALALESKPLRCGRRGCLACLACLFPCCLELQRTRRCRPLRLLATGLGPTTCSLLELTEGELGGHRLPRLLGLLLRRHDLLGVRSRRGLRRPARSLRLCGGRFPLALELGPFPQEGDLSRCRRLTCNARLHPRGLEITRPSCSCRLCRPTRGFQLAQPALLPKQ